MLLSKVMKAAGKKTQSKPIANRGGQEVCNQPASASSLAKYTNHNLAIANTEYSLKHIAHADINRILFSITNDDIIHNGTFSCFLISQRSTKQRDLHVDLGEILHWMPFVTHLSFIWACDQY